MEILFFLFAVYIVYRFFRCDKKSRKKDSTEEIIVNFRFSSGDEFDEDFEDYEEPSGEPGKWYESNQGVNVRGFDIPGGLIYVGNKLLDINGYDNDACLIDPKLQVSSAKPWEFGDEMGYWPQYRYISPQCRGAYLKWLASGRSEPEAYIGYVFLFFYGLERRLIIDGQKGRISEKDRSKIIDEVQRLLKIYGSNRSFQRYASNLLAIEWVLYQRDKPVPDYIDFNNNRFCTGPFQVVLSQHISEGKAVTADLALNWLNLHPDFSLRTPARRCSSEFRELFKLRYTKKFGDGLEVKPNKRRLKIEYHPASSSIAMGSELNIKGLDLPNTFILTGPLKKISALAEECTVELEQYSRYIGRRGNNPRSVKGLALLPKELLAKVSGFNRIRDVLAKTCEDGFGVLSFQEIYSCFEEELPNKPSSKDFDSLANLIEGLGFGVAPSGTIHKIYPKLNEGIVVFRDGHGVCFEPSVEFYAVSTTMLLGAMVSQVDEDISPHEEEKLRGLVNQNRKLSQVEKDSLNAFLHWSLKNPRGLAGLKQRLSRSSEKEKVVISHVLISVALADGRVDPREVRLLKKLYGVLGLDQDNVERELHALSTAREPVTIEFGDDDKRYAIPGSKLDKEAHDDFKLDNNIVIAREEETRQVKAILEDVFSDQQEAQEAFESETQTSTEGENPLSSLDESHKVVFQHLITKEAWKRSDICEMCKKHGLMFDGAMETLNEWAYDFGNAPLIDDGEPIYVDVTLAKEILNVQQK